MSRRTGLEARQDKRAAVDKADAAGEVCDSMEVRKELVRQLEAGEITVEDVQAELKRIKREGKKAGKPTRQQVWNRS